MLRDAGTGLVRGKVSNGHEFERDAIPALKLLEIYFPTSRKKTNVTPALGELVRSPGGEAAHTGARLRRRRWVSRRRSEASLPFARSLPTASADENDCRKAASTSPTRPTPQP